jgi:hypothetical protein
LQRLLQQHYRRHGDCGGSSNQYLCSPLFTFAFTPEPLPCRITFHKAAVNKHVHNIQQVQKVKNSFGVPISLLFQLALH